MPAHARYCRYWGVPQVYGWPSIIDAAEMLETTVLELMQTHVCDEYTTIKRPCFQRPEHGCRRQNTCSCRHLHRGDGLLPPTPGCQRRQASTRYNRHIYPAASRPRCDEKSLVPSPSHLQGQDKCSISLLFPCTVYMTRWHAAVPEEKAAALGQEGRGGHDASAPPSAASWTNVRGHGALNKDGRCQVDDDKCGERCVCVCGDSDERCACWSASKPASKPLARYTERAGGESERPLCFLLQDMLKPRRSTRLLNSGKKKGKRMASKPDDLCYLAFQPL